MVRPGEFDDTKSVNKFFLLWSVFFSPSILSTRTWISWFVDRSFSYLYYRIHGAISRGRKNRSDCRFSAGWKFSIGLPATIYNFNVIIDSCDITKKFFVFSNVTCFVKFSGARRIVRARFTNIGCHRHQRWIVRVRQWRQWQPMFIFEDRFLKKLQGNRLVSPDRTVCVVMFGRGRHFNVSQI